MTTDYCPPLPDLHEETPPLLLPPGGGLPLTGAVAELGHVVDTAVTPVVAPAVRHHLLLPDPPRPLAGVPPHRRLGRLLVLQHEVAGGPAVLEQRLVRHSRTSEIRLGLLPVVPTGVPYQELSISTSGLAEIRIRRREDKPGGEGVLQERDGVGGQEGRDDLALDLLVKQVDAGVDEEGERREEMMEELGSGGIPDVWVKPTL